MDLLTSLLRYVRCRFWNAMLGLMVFVFCLNKKKAKCSVIRWFIKALLLHKECMCLAALLLYTGFLKVLECFLIPNFKGSRWLNRNFPGTTSINMTCRFQWDHLQLNCTHRHRDGGKKTGSCYTHPCGPLTHITHISTTKHTASVMMLGVVASTGTRCLQSGPLLATGWTPTPTWGSWRTRSSCRSSRPARRPRSHHMSSSRMAPLHTRLRKFKTGWRGT